MVWRDEGWQKGALRQSGLDYSTCPSSHIAGCLLRLTRASVSEEVVLAHHHAHSHAELFPFTPRSTLLNEAALILVTRTTLILSRGFLSTQNWHSRGHLSPWVIATRMLAVAAQFCFVNFKKVCVDPQTLSYTSVN